MERFADEFDPAAVFALPRTIRCGVFRSSIKPRAAGAATPTCVRRERSSSGARLLALMTDEGVTGHASLGTSSN